MFSENVLLEAIQQDIFCFIENYFCFKKNPKLCLAF